MKKTQDLKGATSVFEYSLSKQELDKIQKISYMFKIAITQLLRDKGILRSSAGNPH